MIVGIDFDNTLVCYDGIFHAEAHRRGWIPDGIATHKTAVRGYLRSINRDEDFTELQGFVYGPGINQALPYAGAIDCINKLCSLGHSVFIVSHKTRYPYKGPQYDLHEAARGWLESNGICSPQGVLRENVFLENTKEEKVSRTVSLGCTHFIDDLPEFLSLAGFHPQTERMLFAPPREDSTTVVSDFRAFESWGEISRYLCGDH